MPFHVTSPTEIRRSGSSDHAALIAMWDRCSRDSRYQRFHAPVQTMPASYLSDVIRQVPDSLVAVEIGTGAIVGLASLFAVGASSAELGVLVEDGHQLRGIGHELAKRLLHRAPHRGITSVRGAVLSEPPTRLAFARGLLGDMEVRNEGAVTQIRATLAA